MSCHFSCVCGQTLFGSKRNNYRQAYGTMQWRRITQSHRLNVKTLTTVITATLFPNFKALSYYVPLCKFIIQFKITCIHCTSSPQALNPFSILSDAMAYVPKSPIPNSSPAFNSASYNSAVCSFLWYNSQPSSPENKSKQNNEKNGPWVGWSPIVLSRFNTTLSLF